MGSIMNLSNVTNLSDRREPNRHDIRGPNGRYIKADRLDHHEASELAEMMRPVHHVVSPDVHEAAMLDAILGHKLMKAALAVGLLAALLILWSLR